MLLTCTRSNTRCVPPIGAVLGAQAWFTLHAPRVCSSPTAKLRNFKRRRMRERGRSLSPSGCLYFTLSVVQNKILHFFQYMSFAERTETKHTRIIIPLLLEVQNFVT